MGEINFMLQSKGGVGKSYVCSLLAQHKKGSGVDYLLFDADPESKTLMEYPGLDATALTMKREHEAFGGDYDVTALDALYDELLGLPKGGSAIVDPGATGFQPLVAWLDATGFVEEAVERGHQVNLHSVVNSKSVFESATNLVDLCEAFAQPSEDADDDLQWDKNVRIICWLNPYPIEDFRFEGVELEETPVFRERIEPFLAHVLRLPVARAGGGVPGSIDRCQAERLTFAEGFDESSKMNGADRKRLYTYWRKVCKILDGCPAIKGKAIPRLTERKKAPPLAVAASGQ